MAIRQALPARRLLCLCALALLIAAGALAPGAFAAGAAAGGAASGNSFSELTGGGSEESSSTPSTTSSTPAKEPSTSTSTSSGSSTGTVLVLGMVAAGLLIGGIAFVILRDARRVAPVPEGQLTGVGRPGRDPGPSMRNRRAKARAARRQRKRNR